MKSWVCYLIAFSLVLLGLKTTAHADRAVPVVDSLEQGRMNAVKKAHQMTDLRFVPLDSFYANPTKTYKAGQECQGLIYSSVKENHTFVGMDVSFHTFMTALNNPRSVMYTENVSKPPYNGTNCGAYYGTVCSGLVTYALGLNVYIKSYDFASSDKFELVNDQSSKGVQIADVINSGGHVQLVTGIKRNPSDGKVSEIEICEGVRPGCRRVTLSRKELDNKLSKKKQKLYRYKYLNNNKYTPLTDFVAVEGEKITPFKYNNEICTSHGDKACFIDGDSVVLNLFNESKTVEIYRNSVLYKVLDTGGKVDVVVKGLPYGDYKARTVNGKNNSDFTYWQIIDVNVRIDSKKSIVSYQSKNARPVYVEFCSLSGGRPSKGVFELTNMDIQNGFVNVSKYTSSLKQKRYVKVHFESDYGRVTNRPIVWK